MLNGIPKYNLFALHGLGLMAVAQRDEIYILIFVLIMYVTLKGAYSIVKAGSSYTIVTIIFNVKYIQSIQD